MSNRKPALDQPISTQQALIAAIVTAMLGALGGASGGILSADAATTSDVAALRAEIDALDAKLDDIMMVIDAKHPRQ